MPEPPNQEQIDELMRVLAGGEPPKPSSPPPAQAKKPEPSKPAARPAEEKAARMDYEPLAPSPGAPRAEAGLDFLSDVDVNVRVELGSTRMNVQDVLKLGSGSVVALESLVGDPVNIFVNDRLVARGEVLVVNDNFAIRITEVLPAPKPEK